MLVYAFTIQGVSSIDIRIYNLPQMCLTNFVPKSFINLDYSTAKKVFIMLRVCVFGLDNPVSSEDRSPATETGTTSDYSQLNMASLNANVPYDSIQPTYLEVR